jgi:Cupin
MTTRHVTSLSRGQTVEESDFGSITRVTADDCPFLSGMSIKRIVLNPGAMRTPHWHANANELTYCVSGTSLRQRSVTIGEGFGHDRPVTGWVRATLARLATQSTRGQGRLPL